ncbi:MAG: hypothetical protein ABIZ70_12325 [Gemmatimonadales bacterium]
MSSHSAYPSDPVALAFAPAHKSAMGVAVGAAAALSCLLLSAVPLIRGRPPELELELLSQYFYGYDFTWRGAVVGAAWAGFAGFVMGWFFAFLRNALLAFRLVVLTARAELQQTRDFMDHI